MQKLGTFEVSSGKLIVTDPCYERGTWCAGQLDKVRNGTWVGHVMRVDETKSTYPDGIRNAELHAYHTDLKKLPTRWTKTKVHVGVDSGQAGMFDEVKYPHGKHEPERMAEFNDGKFNKSFDEFYELCGQQTLGVDGTENYYAKNVNFKMAGVVDNIGVVSSSGYGDGSYNCYVATQKGQVVAVKIVFIDKRGRGPELPEGAVIAKPHPDKRDFRYAFYDIAVITAKLGKLLDKDDKPVPDPYKEDCDKIDEWNKANANVFPKWETEEERESRYAKYRSEK